MSMKKRSLEPVTQEIPDAAWEFALAEGLDASADAEYVEAPDRTEDVTRYVTRMGAVYRDNILDQISDRDFNRLQELYSSQCNYEGLEDALEMLDEYVMYDQVQYRQSQGAIDNPPRSFDALSEQLEESKRGIKARFEETYPDLDFDAVANSMIAAKYPERYNLAMDPEAAPADAETVERYSYAVDYSNLTDEYQRSKRRDMEHDGMDASSWKANRMKMHEQYVVSDFMERDYRATYGNNIFDDVKSMQIATGPARSVSELDEYLDSVYSDNASGIQSDMQFE